MTKRTKKLSLAKETLRSLDKKDLRKAAGGVVYSFQPAQCPFMPTLNSALLNMLTIH